MEKTTSSVLLHLKFNISGAFLTNHWLLSSSFPSPSTDFKSLIKWSLAQKMISLVASQPGQWSNVVSHYTVVLVIGLRTSSSHKYAGFFPYCWRCITWTSGFPSQTVCLWSCPPIFKPMYFHIYIFFFPREWEHSVGKPQPFSDWWRKSPWNLALLQACMLFAQCTPVIPPPLLSSALHNSGKYGSAQTNPKGTCFQTKNI